MNRSEGNNDLLQSGAPIASSGFTLRLIAYAANEDYA